MKYFLKNSEMQYFSFFEEHHLSLLNKSFRVVYNARKIPKSDSIIVKTGNLRTSHLSIKTPPKTPAKINTSI